MPDNTKEECQQQNGCVNGGRFLDSQSSSEDPASGQQQPSSQQRKPVVYGELVILGYNGYLPQGERGRRRSKYTLYSRPQPNGIKKSRHYIVDAPATSMAVQNVDVHSISYTLSRNQAVIVEYEHDPETDLFQIGRSPESSIDFVVLDTMPVNERTPEGEQNMTQSTISRFACRLLIERNTFNHCTTIYAAGFDSSRNIFLGEKATKWLQHSGMDGLTTNGVLIMHPYDDENGQLHPGTWNEVSVEGSIYSLRESRSAPKCGKLNEDECNILQDFSLIDLCGATLMWRTNNILTTAQIEERIAELNAMKPQCPVGLNTLVISRGGSTPDTTKQPYVYLSCGHVQGFHSWGKDREERPCPICLKEGPVVKLEIGMEPAFYLDLDVPNYAFDPCGHMTTYKTAKFWSSVKIPHGLKGFHSMCPFCATPLKREGYVRLIFQDNLD